MSKGKESINKTAKNEINNVEISKPVDINNTQEQERNDQLARIKKMKTVIDEALDDRFSAIISDEREELEKIKEHLDTLYDKLKNKKYMVAVIGSTSSGKSTFVNAFMGYNQLPTEDAECTRCPTEIIYDEDYGAEIEFFSNDEFNKDFRELQEELDISNKDILDWNSNSDYRKILEMNCEGILEDKKQKLNDIIENAASLNKYIGKETEKLNLKTIDNKRTLKEYITEKGIAFAVKKITVKSDKLESLKNISIYDVPGYDSTSLSHKEQSKKWMNIADAIILIWDGTKPSATDSIQFFNGLDKDNDGIPYNEKTFVFINKGDFIEAKSNFNDCKKNVRKELIKERNNRNYRLISESLVDKRMVIGSALTRVYTDLIEQAKNNDNNSLSNDAKEMIKIMTGKQDEAEALEKIEEDCFTGVKKVKEKSDETFKEPSLRNNYDEYRKCDGIDEIRQKLEAYEADERVAVMKQRINNQAKKVEETVKLLKDKNGDKEPVYKDNTFSDFAGDARKTILGELTKYEKNEKEVKGDTSNINVKLKEIINQIGDVYYNIGEKGEITTAKEDILKKKYDESLNQQHLQDICADYKVRESIQKELYDQFIKSMKEVDTNTDNNECENSKERIKNIFINGLIGEQSNDIRIDVTNIAEEYLNKVFDNIEPQVYYSSMFRRYASILFRLLISYPMVSSNDERYEYFKEVKADLSSLAVYEKDFDLEKPDDLVRSAYLMYIKVLFHDFRDIEGYTKLKEKYKKKYGEEWNVLSNLFLLYLYYNGLGIDALDTVIQKYTNSSDQQEDITSYFMQELHNNSTDVNELYKEFKQSYHDMTQDNDKYRIFESELKEDLGILRELLRENVMKAIALDKTYQDIIHQRVTSLKDSMNEPAFWMDFMVENKSILEKSDSYKNLYAEIEGKRARYELYGLLASLF